MHLKKENLKGVFWAPEFGRLNQYTALLNHLIMSLLETKRRKVACQTEHEVERSRWVKFKFGKRMVKTNQTIVGE